jgi:peroxiredoxin
MALSNGQKAPSFTLLDSDRKERTLADFLGKKTIIASIPGAFTPVCTEELCTFQKSYSELEKLGAQVVTFAPDSPFVLKAYADANNLKYPLLSDYTRTTVKQYGGVHEDFIGMKGYDVPKRSIFVLDQQGVVRYAWITENPGELPPFETINETLKNID